MEVAAADKHRRRALIGEGIRKHHAPGESTIGSWVFQFDDPSFLAICRFDGCCVLPFVDVRYPLATHVCTLFVFSAHI